MCRNNNKASFSQRSVIAIILMTALVFTLMPMGAMSVSAAAAKKSSGKRSSVFSIIKNRSDIKTVRKNGKKMFAFKKRKIASSDSFEEARGEIREYIEQSYETDIKDQSMYSKNVWREINKSYSRINKMVDDAKHIGDLYTTDGMYAYLKKDMDTEAEIMILLGGMIKHYISSDSDITKLVAKAKTELTLIKNEAKKKHFNDFYWGRLKNLFSDAFSDLKKVKNIRDYVLTIVEINGWFSEAAMSIMDATVTPEEKEEIAKLEEEMNEESFDEYVGEEILINLYGEEEEVIDLDLMFGITNEGFIMNKTEVAEVRDEQVERLKEFVDRNNKVGKAEKKKIKAGIDKFRTRTMDKIEDADKIKESGNNRLKKMMGKFGMSVKPITEREFVNTARKYNELTCDYNQLNYYEKNWTKIEKAFFETKKTILAAEYNYEVYGLVSHLKKRLNKVDPLKKQFNKEKKDAVKELKKYTRKINRRKYDQKKVKRVIKRGIADLNKVKKYDIDALLLVEYMYLLEAEACINKYEIKITTKGKGAVVDPGYVKYGKSCTVRLIPKAGYRIKEVTIDGKNEKLKNKYIFKKVKENHKVKVVFGK